METDKMKTYEEIFDGLSKTELYKGCRNRALFNSLTNDKCSYAACKKYYKGRINFMYMYQTHTVKHWPWHWLYDGVSDYYELAYICEEIIKFAKKSEKEVRREAHEYLLKERNEALPF